MDNGGHVSAKIIGAARSLKSLALPTVTSLKKEEVNLLSTRLDQCFYTELPHSMKIWGRAWLPWQGNGPHGKVKIKVWTRAIFSAASLQPYLPSKSLWSPPLSANLEQWLQNETSNKCFSTRSRSEFTRESRKRNLWSEASRIKVWHSDCWCSRRVDAEGLSISLEVRRKELLSWIQIYPFYFY